MADATVGDLRTLLISYPNDLQTKEDKKAFKDELLRKHPETLRADCCRNPARITNLLFYTKDTEAWYQAFCTHYANHTTRDIDKGRQIKINTDGNDDPLTVNVYHSGTVMFQGKETTLSYAKGDFPIIKAEVERGRAERIRENNNLQPGNDALWVEPNELSPGNQTTNKLSEQLQASKQPL